MQRKFLTNLGFLLLLNLIVKPVYIFGIDRTVQNIVGAEDFGFYINLFNFSFLFNILCDFGITNFNNRYIAQNNHLLNKQFSSILVLKLLLGVVYFAVTFLAAILWGYDLTDLRMLLFLGINQFLVSFILYLRSNVSALLLFRTDSMLSVLDRIIMIGIISLLLWGRITSKPFRIEWYVYAQTAAYFLTFLIAFIVVIKKASFKKLNWNYPFFLMILKKSLPFAILVLLMSFYNRLDTVMIVRLLEGSEGKVQSGIYAHAYRMLDAANNIAFLFSMLLLPLFATLLKAKTRVDHLVKLSFSILYVVSVTATVISVIYRHEIMDLLYHEHIEESAKLFPLLMGCFIAISTTYVFGSLLTANGNLKQLNFAAAFGMLVNIALNLVLIPKHGAYGSAWASLVTQMMMAVLQVILCTMYFKFKVDYKYVTRIIAFPLGLALAGYFTWRILDDWLIGLLILGTCSILLAAILKLLSIRYFIDIIKSKTL